MSSRDEAKCKVYIVNVYKASCMGCNDDLFRLATMFELDGYVPKNGCGHVIIHIGHIPYSIPYSILHSIPFRIPLFTSYHDNLANNEGKLPSESQ